MAVGSGIGSQFGIAPETVYGTYVAPTRFYEAKKASVTKVKNTATWDGLAAGRLVDRSDGRVVTTRAAKASIDELVVTAKDMGLLLNMIFGGTVAPVAQSAPTALLQTHALVDNFGKMFTAQSGVPTIGGTVVAQSGLGCKVDEAEFSCGVDDLLTVKVDADAKDITEGQALAAASYAAGRRPFHFGQMGVKIGATVAGATAADGVRKVTCKIDRKMKLDQFYANAAGLKDQPVTNDKVEITGTITVDYKTAAQFADRFRDDTQFALVWEFTGANIATTFFDTFALDMPACFLDDGTPEVDGPDVVTTDFNYKAYVDLSVGTTPITCRYMSTDTVL
jgi:putative ubiquitin-RnfH superfamily antitoxin RatB of RatAB toxin-antitoxin module